MLVSLAPRSNIARQPAGYDTTRDPPPSAVPPSFLQHPLFLFISSHSEEPDKGASAALDRCANETRSFVPEVLLAVEAHVVWGLWGRV